MHQINLLPAATAASAAAGLLPTDETLNAELTANIGPKPRHNASYAPVPYDHPASITNNVIALSAAHAAAEPVMRPSGIYGSGWWKCARSQLYDLLGFTPEPFDYVWEWDLAARLGDAVHNEIQRDLIKRGIVLKLPNFMNKHSKRKQYRKRGKLQAAVEVTLDGRVLPNQIARELEALKLRIRLDVIIKRPNKPQTIVEIKTVDQKYFYDLKKLYKYKMPGYDRQMQMQMHFWRDTETGHRPQLAVCYVINRNNITERMEFPIAYDAAYAEWGVRRIGAIRAAWQRGVLLPAEPGNDCNFCRHFNKCPAKGKDEFLEESSVPTLLTGDETRFIHR